VVVVGVVVAVIRKIKQRDENNFYFFQVLDLEGNIIHDFDEFECLCSCINLKILSVAGNPVTEVAGVKVKTLFKVALFLFLLIFSDFTVSRVA
jgi:hypothetical protein